MAIVFVDFNAVEIDGVNAGDIVSVLSNYPTRKAEVLKAFRDFRLAEKDARDAKVTKAEQDLATKIAEHKTLLDAEKESKRQAIDLLRKEKQDAIDLVREEKRTAIQEARKELDEIKTQLGGEDVVKAKLREERRKAIQEAKAKAIAEQAALEAEEAAL